MKEGFNCPPGPCLEKSESSLINVEISLFSSCRGSSTTGSAISLMSKDGYLTGLVMDVKEDGELVEEEKVVGQRFDCWDGVVEGGWLASSRQLE